MKKVLVLNPYYFPGWRSGGPQQTIMNIVDVFGKDVDIHILTHNHDMGVAEPYPDTEYDTWVCVGDAKVYYSSSEHFELGFLEKTANRFDLVYVCGPYYEESYKLLWLNRLGKIKPEVVLAPMGSFSTGALAQKHLKKKLFWTVLCTMGLLKNIAWSFTSNIEVNEAEACVGKKWVRKYYIAEDLPKRFVDYSQQKNIRKPVGSLKIIFLSRICPKKNLLQAISIVSRLEGTIQFDVYGTREDEEYWIQCEEALRKLPTNITWRYCGEVPAENVITTFLKYDVFLFPTLGENFGHVIYEALVAGCVPLISNRTPWLDLKEFLCGASMALEDEDAYVDCVQRFVDMSTSDIETVSTNAIRYAQKKYDMSIRKSGYREIFII